MNLQTLGTTFRTSGGALILLICGGCGGNGGSTPAAGVSKSPSTNGVPTETDPNEEIVWTGIDSGYSGSTVRQPDGSLVNKNKNGTPMGSPK